MPAGEVQVTDGEVDHGEASTFALMDFEREEGKCLACCARLESDTVIEARSFPNRINAQSQAHPGSQSAFGGEGSVALQQTAIVGFSIFKGATAFKPPEIDFTTAVAFNTNYTTAPERGVLSVNSSKGLSRTASRWRCSASA